MKLWFSFAGICWEENTTDWISYSSWVSILLSTSSASRFPLSEKKRCGRCDSGHVSEWLRKQIDWWWSLLHEGSPERRKKTCLYCSWARDATSYLVHRRASLSSWQVKPFLDLCLGGKIFAFLLSWSFSALFFLISVSTLLMMVTLKKLASIGCTLVFTIYQSSTEVFGLFDRICLLSNGNTLFFGETLACLQVKYNYVFFFHIKAQKDHCWLCDVASL